MMRTALCRGEGRRRQSDGAPPYWSSFARSSPLQELSRTNARVYIAQGSDDRAVTFASAEVLRAGLVAFGKDVTADFVMGADHNFSTE
jgi:predicted esterase